MTLETSRVDAFREKFESVVASTITDEQLIPELRIDAELNLADITPAFYRILCQMEPFGPDNLRPLFLARGVQDTGWSKIVKEDHIRFSLRQNGSAITGIGFGMAGKFPLLEKKQPVDIVFKLDENEWQGQKSLQLRMEDIRPATS
jgi:single-stranded-DNA-specific exonuclease